MIKLVLGALGWQGIALAAAGILLAIGGAYEIGHWRGDAAGRSAIKLEASERAFDLIEKWSEDHGEISNFDLQRMCVEFGRRWVQSDCID